MSGDIQRRILAVATVVSLVVAGAIWFWRPDMELELAFFSRTGGMLAAAWLAYEDVKRLPGWLLLSLPALLIVIVRWPRFLLLLIPAMVVAFILRRLLSPGSGAAGD
jgi:hypothetical protein